MKEKLHTFCPTTGLYNKSDIATGAHFHKNPQHFTTKAALQRKD
jgi:hypothetical protein